MIAEVPAVLREIAAWIGVLTIITVGISGVFRFKAFRWAWKQLVSDPIREWQQKTLVDSAIGRSVLHHLGPNGDTPSITRRLSRVEVALLIDQGREAFRTDNPEED